MTNGITLVVKPLPGFASAHDNIDLVFLTRGDRLSFGAIWSNLVYFAMVESHLIDLYYSLSNKCRPVYFVSLVI